MLFGRNWYSVKDEYPDYEFNIDGKVFAEDLIKD